MFRAFGYVFLLPLAVCGGLRAHQSRQLQEEGGAGRRGGPDRHPGHGGTGGLRRHTGQLLPQRRGLPLRFLHHGAGVVRGDGGLQVPFQPEVTCEKLSRLMTFPGLQGADPESEGGRERALPPGRQQVGPGRPAAGQRGRGQGARRAVGRVLRGDVSQDPRQRRQGMFEDAFSPSGVQRKHQPFLLPLMLTGVLRLDARDPGEENGGQQREERQEEEQKSG